MMGKYDIPPRRTTTHTETAYVKKDFLGLTLGDLRAVVDKAAGMPDTANLFVAGIDKSDSEPKWHWIREIRIDWQKVEVVDERYER